MNSVTSVDLIRWLMKALIAVYVSDIYSVYISLVPLIYYTMMFQWRIQTFRLGGGGGGVGGKGEGRRRRFWGGHLDPEKRGWGQSQKIIFRPFGPQFGLKIVRGGDGPPGPLPWICPCV